MATVSSHVLDAVAGRSAVGVRVECTCLGQDGKRASVFALDTDGEGRISVPVDVTNCSSASVVAEYELVFHTGDYFARLADDTGDRQIMRSVVVRITMPDGDARYHIPVIAAPHSYSVWWSR